MAAVTASRALRETADAFDGVAAGYGRSNAENPILCAMRQRTRAALERAVAPGARILDLGCGPGTDVVYFAARGYRVVAIDWSLAMVNEARRSVRAAGAAVSAQVLHMGIEQLDSLEHPAAERFAAAYSSFGPLNCVTDLARSARAIARHVCRNGAFVASVIGRVCPWELALYSSRGEWRRAAVRFADGAVAVPLEGRTVWTEYYTPGRFVRVFEAAGFETLSVRALGLFAPPPYLRAFAERHPDLVARLHAIDDVVGRWPITRACGDHFLIVMRRT